MTTHSRMLATRRRNKKNQKTAAREAKIAKKLARKKPDPAGSTAAKSGSA